VKRWLNFPAVSNNIKRKNFHSLCVAASFDKDKASTFKKYFSIMIERIFNAMLNYDFLNVRITKILKFQEHIQVVFSLVAE
jgi:hypothetical protein